MSPWRVTYLLVLVSTFAASAYSASFDFYHTMDLPTHGTVHGQWDLRGREASYLGNIFLQGKRVLEIGTASGHLCTTMERMGAEVVPMNRHGTLSPTTDVTIDNSYRCARKFCAASTMRFGLHTGPTTHTPRWRTEPYTKCRTTSANSTSVSSDRSSCICAIHSLPFSERSLT